MIAKGRFEVVLDPQDDGEFSAGRMTIDKLYSGDIEGTGRGQMLSKRTEGVSVYSAIEEFRGRVHGKEGSFTLFHAGRMTASEQLLQIYIVQGSAAGALETIQGEMDIKIIDGKHFYEFNYTL